TGGNDDGFSGTYSFVRKDERGLVLADLKGPGVVYRITTPTPTNDPMEFYFDGEAEPRLRLPFRDLFSGARAPFVRPLVGSALGGNYSYVPIPYERSLEIVLRAEKLQFYQINYATYPAGFSLPSLSASSEDLERARALWSSAGSDAHSFVTPPGAASTSLEVTKRIEPGKTTTLFQIDEPGRIVGMRLSPASAFAGKDRALVLRIYWDDDPMPAVDVPVGDFFGYSFGEPAIRSLLLGTSGVTDYVYFPMPFDRRARIEVSSDAGSGSAVEIEAELLFARAPRDPGEGKFYALWHRENPTTKGKPFTFVSSRGRGHVVGVILQAQGPEPGQTTFFEGDDVAVLDGNLAIHGTGSEDFFNGGWYDVAGRWEHRGSLPVSGCLDYKKHLGRTGAYRLFLTDALAYRESIDLSIEHAPTENDIPTDYTSVTFLYSAERPDGPGALPPAAQRRVVDFDRVVFSPGWNVPIHAFSLQSASLSKREEEIGGEKVRMLSMKAEGEDIFGPHHVAFELEAPEAGRYRVLIEAMTGPSQGKLQLFRNEEALGEPVDLYADERARSGPVSLGVVDLEEGSNILFFRSAGKNAASRGTDLDLVSIVFERIR
ncbi:MAG TPA: glycoside hydrolase family 172 protein, partial [Vicinamibacteria bacterium]